MVINLTDGDRGDIISWYSKAPIRVGYKSKNSFFKKGITHIIIIMLSRMN